MKPIKPEDLELPRPQTSDPLSGVLLDFSEAKQHIKLLIKKHNELVEYILERDDDN